MTATATETAAPPPVVMVIRGANSHRFESAGELAPSALPALPSSLRIFSRHREESTAAWGRAELEPGGGVRTRRSRAVEMSGNRRQPSRRGQVGQGPAQPLGMASHSWTATSDTLRQALLQEVVCFWQPQEGVALSPLPSPASLDCSGTLASSSLTSCLSRPFCRPGKRRR